MCDSVCSAQQFNGALRLWIEIIAEVGDHARARRDGKFEDAPFAIDVPRGEVGGLPIVLTHDSATWTKAMLRALGHLRQLLLWMARGNH